MYRTGEEFCMDLWRDMCGLPTKQERIIPPLEELRRTEWSPEFEQMMRDRLVMGAIRYESFVERKRHGQVNYNWALEARRRIAKYEETGNLELLVDGANFCLVEFLFGQHPKRHFQSKDDGDHAQKKENK